MKRCDTANNILHFEKSKQYTRTVSKLLYNQFAALLNVKELVLGGIRPLVFTPRLAHDTDHLVHLTKFYLATIIGTLDKSDGSSMYYQTYTTTSSRMVRILLFRPILFFFISCE
jgi:hypothetical protein